MIPVKEDRRVISSGVEESIAFGISAKDSVHIMSILRDQLYSDKIAAVIREICANAADANAMAGRADQPINVFVPTLADPCLRIRDIGPGLSLDEVRTVFSQYGASTKRESNEVVGMLGIGSKSPFAYADSFVVISWHGGSKATYNAVIDESGAGRIDLLCVEECDASETGLEVQMAVRPADCRAFEDRAKSILVHFDPRPTINITLPDPPRTRDITNGKIDDEGDYNSGKWTAVMGRIPYPISIEQIESGTGGSELTRAVRKLNGTLYFEIGQLTVAASREALKYSDATRALLVRRLNAAVDEYVRMMLSGLDSQTGWEKRLRVSAVASRGLPVLAALKALAERSIQLDADPSANGVQLVKGQAFHLQTRNYNDRMTGTSHIYVEGKTRLLVKDEKRPMAGYALQQRDIVVVPAPGHEGQTAVLLQGLKAYLLSKQLDGMPVLMLSQVPWNKPEGAKAAVPRDKEKARARVFKLDMKALANEAIAGSTLWAPEQLHDPSPRDVFVVLESYRVPRFESFYEVVREDEALLRNLGLQFPPIIGYKSTKAKPVLSTSCEGSEYHRWRQDGMVTLLLSHPDVAQVAQAMSYTKDYGTGASWFQGNGPGWIEGELGKDHPLVTFAATERGSRMVINKASDIVQNASLFVREAKRSMGTGDPARAAIIGKYPLLAAADAGALNGQHRALWVDYVRLIDSIPPPVAAQQNSQEAA
jgi:hypothetical protein